MSIGLSTVVLLSLVALLCLIAFNTGIGGVPSLVKTVVNTVVITVVVLIAVAGLG